MRLVTYCIMGNHLHALVEVPKREVWLKRFAGEGGEAYRCLLFSNGVEVKDAQNENSVRQGVTAEEAKQCSKRKEG